MIESQLAIFDFDGTLAGSLGWFHRNLNDVARRHGFREIAPKEREALHDLSSREIIARLGVPIWKLPRIARSMRAAVSRDIDQINLFPWVPEMVGGLTRRGVALAIVNSSTETNIRRVLGPDVATAVQFYATGSSLSGKAALIRSVVKKKAVIQQASSPSVTKCAISRRPKLRTWPVSRSPGATPAGRR